jgi:hypothetical protein
VRAADPADRDKLSHAYSLTISSWTRSF